MKHRILTPQRGTSWPSLIGEISIIGEQNGRAFPADKASSIRPAISNVLKRYYPNRVYKANKKEIDGHQVLWVWLKEIK